MLNKKEFTELLKHFQFDKLFNELGWDHLNKKENIFINDEIYELKAVAEKRSFVIFVCSSGKNGKIPDYETRKKIDLRITKLFFEHLIIYTDKDNSHQIWQLAIREPNKPITIRETPYFKTQEPELLFQKLSGLFFSIDDEDKISLVDVKSNVLEQFNTNAEKVTKHFYTKFRDELLKFQKFIKGIESTVDKEWYASLMLNRLMFIYFIQKKGFLDNNRDYLYDKLKESKKKKGDDKFYSFYKNFLLVLFHKGLGSTTRTKKISDDLGIIPYLNGGLFEEHELEKKNISIEIPDDAFERIFKFFDEYNWHLDTRITSSGKDINPDVIGYIFEKYINDRASMGAYYTKEDITEYISKNTIVPFLFDEVKKECANAFREESSLWKMLCENPDRYIYETVRKGIYDDEGKIRELPDEIKIGLNTSKPGLLERRKEWNKSAPEEFALSTEIWREVIERRNSYFEIKEKLVNGEIREINDFITYNLDIRQFAQDAVEQYEGSDFINAFYKAIFKITILDPTCGSGAFLFAALNILEPIYESCIDRMRGFVEEDNKTSGRKFSQFRKILDEIKDHPNQRYYIHKRIILNNLYGVDIMREAVEIAKLRLFLKLVAEVEPDYKKDNLGLEPLPDIDFNIRSGNTLIGFTSHKEIKDVYEECESSGRLMFSDEKKLLKKIDDFALIVSKLFREFKEKQAIIEIDSESIKKTKKEFEKRLKELNDLLNKYKAYEYGIDADDLMQQNKFIKWLNTHKPFHWFAEYYDIINNGGFDVIIGNPPYVEYSKILSYRILNYNTINASNLYAFVVERNDILKNKNAYTGMIIPHSAICTDRMESLMNIFKNKYIWLSTYDIRPSSLFFGIDQRVAIYLMSPHATRNIFSTKYHRWQKEFRDHIFRLIHYVQDNRFTFYNSFPKIANSIELNILKKIKKHKSITPFLIGDCRIYYHNSPRYWIRAHDDIPYFWNERDGEKISNQIKSLSINTGTSSGMIMAVFNSNLFYWWFNLLSDSRHLNLREIESFNLDCETADKKILNKVVDLTKVLMQDYKNNAVRKETYYTTTGQVIYDEYYPKLSKNIIDEIDKVLATHYGFTEEELDYIINYDIKYRMGKELEEGE